MATPVPDYITQFDAILSEYLARVGYTKPAAVFEEAKRFAGLDLFMSVYNMVTRPLGPDSTDEELVNDWLAACEKTLQDKEKIEPGVPLALLGALVARTTRTMSLESSVFGMADYWLKHIPSTWPPVKDADEG